MVWFRNTDLRTQDHEPLYLAHRGQHHNGVTHAYIFDTRIYKSSTVDFKSDLPRTNFPKTGVLRSQFLLESVTDLRRRFRNLNNNQTLITRTGLPEDELPKLAKQSGAKIVYCHTAEAPEEEAVQNLVANALQACDVELRTVWGNTLYHVDDLPFEVKELPNTSSAFKKAVESQSTVRDPLPCPSPLLPLPEVGLSEGTLPVLSELSEQPEHKPCEQAVLNFEGGETAALAR